MLNKREFLKALGIGGGLLFGDLARPRRLFAAAPKRNFVFAYFSGGWDTLLGLDTRDPSVFRADRLGETRIELAFDQLPELLPRAPIMPPGSQILFGPAMTPIAPYFDRMTVVRGVSMDTVTHQIGRRYFLTGMFPRGARAAGSSAATRIVAQQGSRTAIPSLSSRIEQYNEGHPPFATSLSVNGSGDLARALGAGPEAPAGPLRARLETYRQNRGDACDPAQLNRRGLMSLLSENQSQVSALIESGLARYFVFAPNNPEPEIAALRTTFRTGVSRGGEQAALAFQALRHGIAQCVSIEVANGLDTHGAEWADEQLERQMEGWQALATLVESLANEPDPDGGSLLDYTTICVFSEFGRTALLNSLGGRDHSLTNACLLIGAGVPKNRVVGASSDVAMVPREVDPVTGAAVDAGGVVLTPARVLASVLKSAGLDPSELRVDGMPCLMG